LPKNAVFFNANSRKAAIDGPWRRIAKSKSSDLPVGTRPLGRCLDLSLAGI
jgi:hypothetical protein